ncbi:isochorismatase hydrolase (macronuclear) [Tetrahymena thermophila SB210]|uniref:Isochorismatase hydrolase n=1 Tax=Tetrahymena thermophila (strain SB210) TaxID=312017 RepID=I7ME43_TETTS|nr:isochorismatase hydrolase [Tetrahymena thermophila SB210]EAR94213.1 isochorismatase hydrolase [Tetrahymena thermophila SB210]|eukprot:XP_001014458.1 isochorismatase hydrolase [Tetrahymena thermophila SB210]
MENNKNSKPQAQLPHRIEIEETIFLSCDQQSSFHKHIFSFDTIVGTAKQLIRTASLLGLPVLVTEQNPQKLGNLIIDLQKELPQINSQVIQKMSLSMVNDQTKQFLNKYPHRKTAILFGVEAHAAIQQTTLDLISLGYKVYLITDGISSQRKIDRSTAFRRLENEGAILATSESVIFELIRTAKHPQFKKILNILKMDRVQAIAKL